MRQPLLDAAIIGAQKCGTTALATFLDEHPTIVTPQRKELHAFDNPDQDWRDPDWDQLVERHFPATEDGQLRLDATPITLYWPGAVQRLARWCPDVRVIVLLRHPTDRAWSHWRMERGRGNEDLPFSAAIREGRRRVAAAPDGHHRIHSYVERGFYAAQLDRVHATLPSDQVLVLRQQDLLDDHAATLRRVHDFLDLAPAPLPPPARVFATPDTGPPLAAADRAHLDDLFADDLDRLVREHDVDLRR